MSTKAGSRHNAADRSYIQSAHDMFVKAGAKCATAGKTILTPHTTFDTGTINFLPATTTITYTSPIIHTPVKASARHSSADAAMIQEGHDLCVKQGATCMPTGSAKSGAADVDGASQVLQLLSALAESEQYDGDAEGLAQIQAIMQSVIAFIESEVNELSQNPNDEAVITDAPKEEGETVVSFGGDVKAIGENRFTGVLVRFSDARNPDLAGDFFTKSTDFQIESGARTPIYFNHRLPVAGNGVTVSVKQKIGEGTMYLTDEGVIVDAILYARDQYERAIVRAAKAGKVGWSSGTAAHLVEREREGKAYHIKAWPLGLDASMTPTPAEPKNTVIPLKSLHTNFQLEDSEAVPEATVTTGAGNAAGFQAEAITTQTGELKMSNEQVTAPAKPPMTEKQNFGITLEGKAVLTPNNTTTESDTSTEVKSVDLRALMQEVSSLKTALTQMTSAYNAPTTHKAPIVAPAIKQLTQRGESEEDVRVFRHWIKTGDNIAARRTLTESDPYSAQDGAYKAAFAEGTGANGGFIVPVPYHNEIIAKRDEISIVRKMGVKSIKTALASVGVPVENAKMGNFAITAEAAAADESEPTFAQVTITVYAWRRVVKVSQELLQDQTANFDQYIMGSFGRALGLTENNYFLVGTGSGQPQGAVVGGTLGVTAASATAITAAEVVNLVYKLPSGYRDKAAIVMAIATEGTIRGLTGNPFQLQGWAPAGAANPQNPYGGGTILGYPTFNSASMPAIATTNKTILIGNFDFYGIAERQDLVVTRANELYMANGQVGLFAFPRFGGAVLQAEAFQYLQQA